MSLKVYVIGATSFVGHAFIAKESARVKVGGCSRRFVEGLSADLDIFDYTETAVLAQYLAKFRPDVVVNACALGDVDYCETHQAEARRVNVQFPLELAGILQKNGSPRLLHFSSNAVYDGESPPYSESSARHPVNYYGETKHLADVGLVQAYERLVIIRPMTMFGPVTSFQRSNPATMILSRLIEGKSLELVDDVFGNLLYLDDLLDVLSRLIESDMIGEFNIAGQDRVSRYEFGLLVARVFGLGTHNIKACSSERFPTTARRPRDTTFSTERAKEKIGFVPSSIESALRRMRLRTPV